MKNPSFEGSPHVGSRDSPGITGWNDCGPFNFPDQSPPDIHPIPKKSAWGVTKKAQDGETYLGLVTRYSDTFESISQSLTKPVEAGKCYNISVYLALSEAYDSPTQRSQRIQISSGNTTGTGFADESFSYSVELFIWGGDDLCRRHKLLAHSGPVENQEWKLFNLEFSPKSNHQYITIGAYYKYGYLEPYNGHILVDGLSPIVEVDCQN